MVHQVVLVFILKIVVSETTPNILYYQCSSHGYMGSRIDTPSSTSVIIVQQHS